MNKDDFIRSVRQALGRDAGPPGEPYALLQEGLAELEARVAGVRERLDSQRPQLLDRLAQVAQTRGWQVQRAQGVEEALSCLAEIARNLDARLVVRSSQDVFQQLPVDHALAEQGVEVSVMQPGEQGLAEPQRQVAARADLGITGVDYAVAETGSAVLLPGHHLSRLTSLLPPVHLAIVRPQEVVESLDDLFLLRRLAYHQGDGDMGSYLNFITGPSRTADIEQTIVVGVHGPRQVHMLILG